MTKFSLKTLFARTVALVVAAVALGLAFDAAHPAPLLVGTPTTGAPGKPDEPAEDDASGAIDTPPKAQQNSADGYYKNEMISAEVQPQDQASTQQEKTGFYSNQTLDMRLIKGAAETPADPQPEQPAENAVPEAIGWPDAKVYLEDPSVVLVDARPRAVYQAGSIPGAVSLPYGQMDELMPTFSEKYNRDRFLIVYCSDAACATSEKVAKLLMTKYDYQNVLHMPGGYEEWRRHEAGDKKPQIEGEQQQ